MRYVEKCHQSTVPCFSPTPTAWNHTVFYTAINTDGTLTPWSIYNNLPVPVVRHAIAADRGIIFSIGGSSGQDTDNIGCIQGVCSAPYIRESGIYLLDLSG